MPFLSSIPALSRPEEAGQGDPSDRGYDRFLPVVRITPVSGFPDSINVQSDVFAKEFEVRSIDRLQSFVLTDNDKKLDICELSFIDDEGQFVDPNRLAHGAVIDASWGYPGKMSQKRRLIVRRLKIGLVQGRKWAKRRRGYIVTIEALAPGILYTTRPPTGNDLFEGKPLSEIVLQTAKRMGFSEAAKGAKRARVEIPKELDVVHKSIIRTAEMSYGQFLKKLADHHGLIYAVGRDGLLFAARDDTATPNVVIDLDDSSILGFDFDADLTLGIPAGIEVAGYDPSTQKDARSRKFETSKNKGGAPGNLANSEEQATAGSAPQDQTEVEPTPNDVATANAKGRKTVEGTALYGKKPLGKQGQINLTNTVLEDFRPAAFDKVESTANRLFRERKKRKWSLRLRLVGDPRLLARQTVLLKNFETPILDDTWLITEAKHTIDSNGYVTELQLKREGSITKAFTGGPIIEVRSRKFATTKEQEALVLPGTKVVEAAALLKAGGATHKRGRKTKGRKSHDTSGNYADNRYGRRGE